MGYLDHIVKVFPYLVKGAGYTIGMTTVSIFFGGIIGLFICLAKMSKNRFARSIGSAYVDLLRGTPLLVQILFIYFGIPNLLRELLGGSYAMHPLLAGGIAFSLNSGAYMAEIFRGGIQSIDYGQMEAARSLGLNYIQSMRHVILPQAFRRVIPPLGNEFIILLKDTSLLSTIAVTEIVKEGQLYIARTYAAFPTYLAIAVVYLIMTITISKIFRSLEERMSISDRCS